MKYDFTSIMNRHGKDAIAVDSVGQMNGFAPEAPKPGFDVIPMWVADMNFPTVPTIQQSAPSTRPLAILVRPMNIMIPSSAGTRPATA